MVSRRSVVPTVVVLLLIVAGLILVAEARFRRGGSLLSLALLLTAVLRVVLPEDRMGPLAVRSKPFDVAFCLTLAGVIGGLVLAAA